MAGSINDLLQHFAPLLHRYGLWFVFFNLFFETLGIPLPGETMLIAAALLAAKGVFSLPALLVAAWAASVLGDNAAFYVGRIGGRRFLLRFGGRFGMTRQRIRKMEHFYQRFGPEVVIIARFFAVARQLNGLVAGSSGMRPLRFLIYNLLGAALWVGAWAIGAYYLGHHIQFFITWSSWIALSMMALSAITGIGFLIYRWRRNRKR